MANPVDVFEEQKATMRLELAKALEAYQALVKIDLEEITRENASELYQEYAKVEAVFDGFGGFLDKMRYALATAGEAFTDQLGQIGFAGNRSPVVTDLVEDEEYGEKMTPID